MLLVIIFYILSLKDKEDMDKLDKKEHQLYFLYPMVKWLIVNLKLKKILDRNKATKKYISAIYVRQKPDKQVELYWYKKGSIIILILFLFNFLSLVYSLQNMNSSIISENNVIMRPSYGEGAKEHKLTVEIENNILEDEHENIYSDIDNEIQFFRELILKVEEQKLNKEELKEAFKEAKEYLDISILGENESLDWVDKDLYFCSKIPSSSITVRWKPEDANLISYSGKVYNKDIDATGVITSVTATLSYGEEKIDYIIPLHIMPKPMTKDGEFTTALEEELNKAAQETIYNEYIRLPDSLGNYRLQWKVKQDKTGRFILIMGIVLAILMWFQEDKNLEKKVQKRKDQMLIDYPEIINKFTLLVNAGMTVKQAWLRISEDYMKKRQEGDNKGRYAYEEMVITAREISLGISETTAYEQFAKRAGLLPYMKFATLISQNLRKGSKGLSQLLSNEAAEAYEERKETAKKLGEQAGTKLLLPMMIMLLIVLIIIIIPAFMSFKL